VKANDRRSGQGKCAVGGGEKVNIVGRGETIVLLLAVSFQSV
jgi:hypothetical protein